MIEPLQHIFNLQTMMQIENSKKRPAIISPGTDNVQDKIQAAMYYWNCATAEFSELMGSFEKTREYDKEEYIDILHFIVAMLIYVEQKPEQSLERYMKDADTVIKTLQLWHPKPTIHAMVLILWSRISLNWGEALDQLPFKNWKTHEPDDMVIGLDGYEAHNILISFFALGYSIGMDANSIYEGYLNKNKVNHDRQKEGGRYEK